jgi:hypothetical protein
VARVVRALVRRTKVDESDHSIRKYRRRQRKQRRGQRTRVLVQVHETKQNRSSTTYSVQGFGCCGLNNQPWSLMLRPPHLARVKRHSPHVKPNLYPSERFGRIDVRSALKSPFFGSLSSTLPKQYRDWILIYIAVHTCSL